MATIYSEKFTFSIDVISIDFEQENKGNPYNTICDVKIISNGFSCKTKITTNSRDLKSFHKNLEKMYEVLEGKAILNDFDYGTKISVECDCNGFFIFEGILIDESFQQLQFKNQIDQTYLYDFIKELSRNINN